MSTIVDYNKTKRSMASPGHHQKWIFDFLSAGSFTERRLVIELKCTNAFGLADAKAALAKENL